MAVPGANSRRERNLQLVRECGVEIAERIVSREGLAALNARGLAGEIGCSVGTLYNAFGHLDGVIREVNLRSMTLLLRDLSRAAAEGMTARQKVTNMAGAYFDFALMHAARWQAIFEFQNSTAGDGRLSARQAEAEALLFQAAGLPADARPSERTALRLLWASVHGLVTLASRDAIPDVPARTARRYLGFMVGFAFRDGLEPLGEGGDGV